MRIIPKFNPYTMSDDLILKLNTGRTRELAFVLEAIHDNAKGGRASQHILLHGPRGNGKSFFLRLMQIRLKGHENLECFLFPEEQNNFFQPSDLIRGIRQFIQNGERTDGIAGWASGGREEWDKQSRELEAARESRRNTHFVIGIENFDMLFGSGGAFESREDQFLLREFLTTTPWLTLAATTLHPDLDAQYEKALFHSFAKLVLTPWENREHQSYLHRRMRIDDLQATPLSQAQLKTLTRFTGGIPRITVIMADVLSQDQLESTTRTLENTIDILTPFYQDLLSRIPTKSKLLFDALIRGGEPCSQSELAARVGTSQNVIARSFKWLQTHQYLTVDIPEGEKQRLYFVRDRLFAHYYQMRHIHSHSGKSILAIMSEFLTSFYNSRELKKHAVLFFKKKQPEKSRDLLQISLKGAGIDAEALSWKDDIQSLIQALDLKDTKEVSPPETFEDAKKQLLTVRDMLAACTHGPKELNKVEFSRLLLSSLSLSTMDKIGTALKCINNELDASEWETMLSSFKREKSNFSKILGISYNLLAYAMIEGDAILDCMNNELLDRIKTDNPLLYLGTLEGMGIYSVNVGRYKKALTYHKKALEISIKEEDISGHVFNLGRIGWSLEELTRHEEALSSYEKLLGLWIQEGHISEQAWTFERIGWNLKELNRHEEALNAHEKALKLRLQERKISEQAWNLDQIGTNLEELNRREEALDSHKKALKLLIQVGNISDKASVLDQIGCNLNELNRHEEALDSYKEALKLWTQEGDIHRQALSLSRIGWSLMELNRHEEALVAHQQALEFGIREGDISGQALNLGQIGLNLELLNRHEEALDSHEKALKLWIQEGDISGQTTNLGQMAVNLTLAGKISTAWRLIDEHSARLTESCYEIVKQIGEAINYLENKNGYAKAFYAGVDIIKEIRTRDAVFTPNKAMQAFLTGLLEENVKIELVEDLTDHIVEEYGEEMKAQLQGISGVILYLKSGKSRNHLIKMPPEKRKVVEVLVEELDL